MQDFPSSGQPLKLEAYRHTVLKERLLAEFPDLDDETLADTLDGLTSVREMLAALVRSALEDEALASGLSMRLADMKARQERFEARAKSKRSLALSVMTETEIPKLAEPDFTASLRQGAPGLEVLAEDKIPEAFWKPQPPKLDRQGLVSALKQGQAVEGAALGPRLMQLSVRTK
jgi:hypothetical protein